MTHIARLRDFVVATTRSVERLGPEERAVIGEVKQHLAALIAHDDWLPEEFTRPHLQYYSQYLLHADPLERFSVVSFVWGPGQKTPIHDHRVWGVVGVLRGAELSVLYGRDSDGRLTSGPTERLEKGAVVAVSPTLGDIHTISNAYADRPSISIHVYGANIGAVKRAVYDPATGAEKPFISGYSSAVTPNLWDRSKEDA